MKTRKHIIVILSLLLNIFPLFSQNSYDYFPLNIGNKWTYVNPFINPKPDSIVAEIIALRKISDKNYYELTLTENSPVPGTYYRSTEYLRKEANRIFSFQNGIEQVLYQFDADTGMRWSIPEYSSGETFIRNYSISRKNYEITWNSSNYKDCIFIHSQIEGRLDSDVNYEFIPGIGRFSITIALTGRWELVDYKIITGVDEEKFSDDFLGKTISPNPASDFIEISLGAQQAMPKQIKIYDVFGQEVNPTKSQDYPTPALPVGEGVRLDVSLLPPGLYFVLVGEKLVKFMKI